MTPTATLISLGLVPNYSAAISAGKTSTLTAAYPTPSDEHCGIPCLYVSGRRGRRYRHHLMGGPAAYLCGINTAQHLNDMLANLEGSASEPWHFRDMVTGAPIDTVTYPECVHLSHVVLRPWFWVARRRAYSVFLVWK